MKLEQMELDGELKELTHTLKKMRKREKITASQRRGIIRAHLMERFGEMKLTTFHTRIGWIGVAFSERGLVALHLPRSSRSDSLASLHGDFPDAAIVDNAPDDIVREMTEYAEGRRRKFDLKLDWSALKPFQRRVLQAANTIPFGETRTYAWVAQQIGNPQASRAVGRALATNPIPIILPCHRVLGSDGGLHGYAGGLPMKARLLRIEGVKVADAFVVA